MEGIKNNTDEAADIVIRKVSGVHVLEIHYTQTVPRVYEP